MVKRLLKIKKKKGQQMVEFAVVLPVLVLCIGFIVTMGQYLFAKMTVQLAAYEGARKAVVVSSMSSAKTTAINNSKKILDTGIGLSNYQYSFSAPSWTKGSQLTYTVTANVKTLFPLIWQGNKFTGQPTVKGTIVMMVERN